MRRLWSGVALAGVLVLAGVAAGIWVLASRPGSPAAGSGATAPATPVVARVPVPGKPRQLFATADGLWVVSDAGLHHIDPATNQVVVSVPVGPPNADLGGLGLSATTAWIPQERSRLLWRVDRSTNRVRGRVDLGQVLYGPVGVATQADTVWVACCGLKYGVRPTGTLLRVDGRRGKVTGRVAVPEGPLAPGGAVGGRLRRGRDPPLRPGHWSLHPGRDRPGAPEPGWAVCAGSRSHRTRSG